MSLPLFEALAEINLDLRQLRVRWALLGGLAVSIRSEPRTTKDIDLAIAVADDREAERIIGDFMARGYRMLHEPLERTDMDRMSTVRLVASARSGRVIVDLLFASSGIEPEIVAAAELREAVPGVELPVITTAHLLAVKILAGRDKDRADIQSLLRYASQEDLLEAREALDLISRRGFDQGRNLQVELAEHVARFSQSVGGR